MQESLLNMASDDYPTRLDLALEVQVEVIATLNQTLADTIDLHIQVRGVQWNVEGMQFSALYPLLGQVATQLNDIAALVGERIAALGGTAMVSDRPASRGGASRTAIATTEAVIERSRIPKYSLSCPGEKGHILLLAEKMSAYAQSMRSGIAIAQGLDEYGTAALYIDVSRNVDRLLWMLEAHLQA